MFSVDPPSVPHPPSRVLEGPPGPVWTDVVTDRNPAPAHRADPETGRGLLFCGREEPKDGFTVRVSDSKC